MRRAATGLIAAFALLTAAPGAFAGAPACDPAANIVQNPGFEDGDLQPWTTLDADPAPELHTSEAHGGTASAYLGSPAGVEPKGEASIFQTIAVPPTPSALSFWYFPDSYDTGLYDWQESDVTDTGGAVLATVLHVTSNARIWTEQTVDMTPYAGRTVRLLFKVHQDGADDPTSMAVDDVCLSPAPAAPPGTATAPPTATAPVPATTPPATTPAPAARCTVPKLKGMTLAAARRALTAAHCRLGAIRHAFSRTVAKGRVSTQSVPRGRMLPAGQKVGVTVSRGRRRAA